MRTCDACGFENAEPGKPCALCGASEVVLATAEASTLASPGTPTPAAAGAGAAVVAAEGQVLGERYRVDSLLGRGGMGQVFRVTARELAAELRRTREGGAKRLRVLASGDGVVLDPGETTDWALVLRAPREKTGWTEGMALRFEERYYRLAGIRPPESRSGAWTYLLAPWTEGQVFRRVVDYDQDCAARAEARGLRGRLTRWLGKPE